MKTHLRPAVAYAGRSLGRLVAVLAAVACGLVASAAVVPGAFAMTPKPASGGRYGPAPAVLGPAASAHVVTADGVTGWQIILIALVAAIVVAIAVVLLDRRRSAAPPLPAPRRTTGGKRR